ncbi:GntR family transcriptional regulator [Terrarubrum flagellatum]|uniref:GntR family transcriptional regulator n=1 Tax=Terrirubrum flagellatum TaxID=2895980 RepID=UPI0031452B03
MAAATPTALAKPAGKPVYVAIQDYILELISGPDFSAGDRVPSERALAEQLGANRMTVRKAIDKLVERGVLERNGTSGTRIPLPRVARPIDVRSSLGITRIIHSGGAAPGNKLLHFGQSAANDKVAERLKLPVGAELVMFRRLWTVNDTPFCIETSYLPAERFPDLVAEDLVAGQSLYGLLQERYGVAAHVADREISVGACTDLEAKLLGMKPASSALVLRLVANDAAGKPVEYMKSVNHPQLVVFRTSASPA